MPKKISNSIIVVNTSDRFSNYLTGSSIDNTHMKSLSEFNNTFTNYPLTVEKIVVFESAIIDINTVQEFSRIILSDYSQVGEIVFLIDDSFRNYFEVSLENFQNKKFLPRDITNSKLEEILTERQAFKLKNKAELGNVYQVKRKALEETPDVPKYKTYVTVGRSTPNSKLDKESGILDRDINIEDIDLNPEETQSIEFNYISRKPLKKFINNNILVYDSGINIYKLILSDYSSGRKLLFIDNTDSMLFSFLVEENENLPKSLSLEYFYREGMHTQEARDFFNKEEICIVRNSYAMKTSANQKYIDDMILFLIGNYGDLFHSIYILTDDLKVQRRDALRYILMPASMDNLMKLMNYIDKSESSNDLRNIYIKLVTDKINREIKINEQVVRIYAKDLDLENIIVIDNPYTETSPDDTYLFDIVDIELGKFQERRNINADSSNRKKRLSIKS